MSLSSRIAKLRTSRKETLQQVADAVGVSKAHIWELEKGRSENPSVALVTRLAEHFGLTIAALLEEKDSSGADTELQSMFRHAKELTKPEREIIEDMMMSLLKLRKK